MTVSSNAHKLGRIHFENLNLTGEYKPVTAYAQSKLANLLFTLELQRRLGLAGSPVRAMAAHPGVSSTNLVNRGNAPSRLWTVSEELTGVTFPEQLSPTTENNQRQAITH